MSPFLNETSPMSIECISMIKGLGNDEFGTYLVFDHSIFMPKGKGIPSDAGVIHVANDKISVLYATLVNNEIRHYICSAIPLRIGQYALLKVNQNLRLLHTCIREASIIIDNVIHYLHPDLRAANSSLYAGNSYIDYYCKEIFHVNINHIEDCANNALKEVDTQGRLERNAITLSSRHHSFNIFGLMSRICIRNLKRSNKNLKLMFDVL